jgi:hypothetical protein
VTSCSATNFTRPTGNRGARESSEPVRIPTRGGNSATTVATTLNSVLERGRTGSCVPCDSREASMKPGVAWHAQPEICGDCRALALPDFRLRPHPTRYTVRQTLARERAPRFAKRGSLRRDHERSIHGDRVGHALRCRRVAVKWSRSRLPPQ